MNQLQQAKVALEGLSVGDAFGQMFFISEDDALEVVRAKKAPPGPWYLTDDSIMSLGVLETLEACGEIDPDVLAARFAENYIRNPRRGYGGMAHHILQAFARGEDWRKVAPGVFDGSGSFGNGAAMRAAPLGAYFSNDPERVVAQAVRSARVTHSHPDGIAGAVAVASVAGWIVRNSPVSSGDGIRLLEYAFEMTGAGQPRDGIAKALSLPFSYSIDTAVSALGNGHALAAFDTVPIALWCAARHITDFEEALWATVSALGDRDTTCAIVGGLVALNTGVPGIPADWLEARESLSDWESSDEKWGRQIP